MSKKSQETLKFLIHHFSEGDEAAYLEFLPEEERGEIEAMPVHKGKVAALLKEPWQSLKGMHYSWMLEAIRKLSGPQQYYTIASLGKEQQEKLAEQFQISSLPDQLIEPLKALFLRTLFQKMELPPLPSYGLMNKGEFGFFSEMSRDNLLDLVDLLSVFDVAAEIRQIVDREQLHRIVRALTEEQQRFLKVALRLSAKWNAIPIGLVSWAGDPIKLARTLHRRGLMRLAYLLSPESKSYLLYLGRKLDFKRAKILEEYASEEVPKEAKSTIASQVKQTLEFINGQKSV